MFRLEAFVLFGVFAPFVAHALPFGAEQDQEDYGANEGDKDKEVEPAASAYVVQAADTDGNAGDENGERVDPAQDEWRPYGNINHPEHYSNEDVE